MSLLYYWAKFVKKIRGSALVRSNIHVTSKVESGSHLVNVVMGKHSFCGYDCEIINCEIGSFCSIANKVSIGGGMHPVEWVSTSPVFYEGRDSVKVKYANHKRPNPKITKIMNDVWIGEGVFIKQGVTIGNGAIVGMNSVVTKDVEDYSIVAGCPAKNIRKRFSDTIIASLLNIKWWNFSDEEMLFYAQYFRDPFLFIETYKKMDKKG